MRLYRSPIRIAGITNAAAATDRKAVLLQRKKLLAELELSDSNSITVAGAALSRQDIIHLFDELGDEQSLAFHIAVWQDAALLAFLEAGEVTGSSWAANPLYDNAAFLRFVSPWFAAALSRLQQSVLKHGLSPAAYYRLMNREKLLLPQDIAPAYEYASRFFLEKKSQLLAFAYRLGKRHRPSFLRITDVFAADKNPLSGKTVSPAEIHAWCGIPQTELLNMLPDELFDDMRYQLANGLNQLCVISDRRKRAYRTAYAALLVAARIHTRGEMQRIIIKNTGIIKKKVPFFETGPDRYPLGRRKKLSGLGVAIYLAIIFIKAIAGTDDDRTGTDTNSRAPLQYVVHDLNPLVRAAGESQRLIDNYTAIYNALSSLGTYSISGKPDTMRLSKPAPHTDPLQALWRYTGDIDSAGIDAGGANTLPVQNNSSRALLALYIAGNARMHAAWIPAHSTDTIRYAGGLLQLNVIPGQQWDSTFPHYIPLQRSHKNASASVLLYGGFARLPDASQRAYQAQLTWLLAIEDSTIAATTDMFLEADDREDFVDLEILQQSSK